MLLVMSVTPMTVAAECEGQCFSAEDAKDCVEAEKKWQRCKSELVKCDKVEAENQRIAGRLNECRESAKQRKRLLNYQTTEKGELKARNKSLRETQNFYLIGGTVLGASVTTVLFIVIPD